MIKKLLLITLFFISVQLKAQYFLTGVEPFNTKWRQIRTNSFRILFPLEAEKIAVRYANLLSVIDTITPKSLNANQKLFDVVLHNHSILSNGFVAWAPKRMEIITQPSSSTYAQPWLTQLALHETRHTSQLYKLNGGIIKPASFLFGEQIVGAAAGLIPNWFLEGDAVAFETASSNSGRGRQADFYQYYRTHFLTKTKKFKYDKWLMGSFKDNIPNHYNLGYQLVSYTITMYGDGVWANTLSYVSRNPFTVFPFYFGLKQQTGLSRKKLFEKTFNHLDSLWVSDKKSNKLEKLTSMVEENKEYADYRYPHLINDSTLVIYKTSLSRTPRFILVDTRTKKERALVQPGFLTSTPSYYKDNILWTEYQPHVRWEYTNYSIIKWYRISTGHIKTISDKGRYFSPVYNPIEGLVYVISGKDCGNYSIDAFDLEGRKVKSLYPPQNLQPFELIFSSDNKTLLLAVVGDNGKSIFRLNGDGTCNLVFGPTFLDIHSLSSFDDFILFSTSHGYKEDLFALNMNTKDVNQITFSDFGCTDPVFYQKLNKIIFSNYTASGYRISEKTLDTTENKIILEILNDDLISKHLSSNLKFNIDSIVIPNNTYKAEKYSGIKTLLNIHSWAPFFFDPMQLTAGDVKVQPGFTVFSQNLTGSSVLTAGYGYDKVSLARINYQYYGLFPVIYYQFELSGITPTVHFIKKTINPLTEKQRKESTLSVYLPLRLGANSFSTLLYPFFQMISSNDYFLSTKDSLYHKGFQRLNYRIYFSSLQKQAVKNVRPRFGFVTDLNFQNAPFNRNNLGSIFSGDFSIYLPGIGKNHSLLIKHSIQSQNIKRYLFSNKITFPRGYLENYSESYKSISFEYLLPIAYPDFACGSVAYLKRISLNAFYDYAENRDPFKKNKQIDKMNSFGVEVLTDFNLFRTKYPIRLMIQTGWTGDNLVPFNSFSVFVDFYGQ